MPAGGSIPCWKERTKGQWLVAARLRWVLDTFYVTLFLTLSPERLVMTTSEPWGFSHDSTPSLRRSNNNSSELKH